MSVVLVTPPAVEPLTTAEARAHLREDDTDEDSLVDSLVTAARQYVERVLRRQLITATWRLELDGFPGERPWRLPRPRWWDVETIRLPFPPLQSVDEIEYTDTAGADVVLASSEYTVDGTTQPARVVPAFGKSWPSTRDDIATVRVEYTAGYGDDATDIPESIRHAIRLLVGHWYEHREAVTEGPAMTSVPRAVDSLLWSERVAEAV